MFTLKEYECYHYVFQMGLTLYLPIVFLVIPVRARIIIHPPSIQGGNCILPSLQICVQINLLHMRMMVLLHSYSRNVFPTNSIVYNIANGFSILFHMLSSGLIVWCTRFIKLKEFFFQRTFVKQWPY